MNVTVERQEKCMVKLTISVDDDQANEYMRRAARTIARSYRMPGFRPGKAPYNVIVRRLGVEAVQAQVLDQFGDEIYQQGLVESEIDPADSGSLDEVTWGPLTLHLTVPVAPEIDLGSYRDIRVPWEDAQVTDEALQEALVKMQKEQSEWTPEERPAELGDQVVLDIKGTVEDQVVLENVGRELVLNGDSPYPIPGFAHAVLGMTPGEEREFDLAYPEDHYNKDIAGKLGHFDVRLEEIRVQSLPELDDEFAMLVGDYENLDDLKAQLSETLLKEAQEQADRDYEEQIWAQLLQAATIEYPEVALTRELESIKSQLEAQLKQQNMDLATYWQLTGSTEEAWAEQMRPQAEERLKRNLILTKVIKDQNLQLEAEDIEAEIEAVVEPMGERADELREFLNSPTGRTSIADSVIVRKALDRIKAIARGEVVEPEAETEPAAEADAAQAAAPAADETAAEQTATEPALAEEPAEAVDMDQQAAAPPEDEPEAAPADTECTLDAGAQDDAPEGLSAADSTDVGE